MFPTSFLRLAGTHDGEERLSSGCRTKLRCFVRRVESSSEIASMSVHSECREPFRAPPVVKSFPGENAAQAHARAQALTGWSATVGGNHQGRRVCLPSRVGVTWVKPFISLNYQSCLLAHTNYYAFWDRR